MVFPTNWLPDWKGTLNAFYDEKLKDTIEQKSTEYKAILLKFQHDNKKFQQAVLIILLTGLSFYTIAKFWHDKEN